MPRSRDDSATEEMVYEGIPVKIVRKNVKNLRISVHSDCTVRLTIPKGCDPLDLLEKKVREFIDRDEKIYPGDGNYVHMGDLKIYCTGKRIHAKSTGQIENFRLVKEFIVDPITKEFLLIGIAGPDQELQISTDAQIAH